MKSTGSATSVVERLLKIVSAVRLAISRMCSRLMPGIKKGTGICGRCQRVGVGDSARQFQGQPLFPSQICGEQILFKF